MVLFMLSKNPVFPVLWKFYNLIPLAFKVKFPGGSQIANIHQIIEKSKRVPEKHLVLLYWLCQSRTTTNCGKILKRLEYQTTLSACWELCIQVKKQELELDTEQQNGSKSGKEYIKAIYCHSAYLTSMQSTSWEILGWMKYKLESRLQGEISIISDMQMTPPLWQRVKK